VQANYNNQSSYSVFTRHRPIRIAFLLDPANASDDLLNTILEFNLQLWGGRYNPIIPCNGAEISESFWRLLVFSDPDIVISYVKLQDDLIEKIDRKVSPYYLKYADDGRLSFSFAGNEPIANEFLIKDINNLGLRPFYAVKCPLVVFKMRETSSNRSFLLRNFGHLPYMLQFITKPGDKEFRPELNTIYQEIDTYQIDGDNKLENIIDDLSKKKTLIYPMSISAFPVSRPAQVELHNDHGFHLAIGDDILNFLYLWNRSHISAPHRFDQMFIPEGILGDTGSLNSIKRLLGNYVYRGGAELTLISSNKTGEELNKLAEFFKKDTYWRVKTISSEGFCFPMIAKSDLIPFDYEKTGETYKFYDKTALIPNKGPLPTGASLFSQKGSWVLDTNIIYRPERFSYTNQEYWWNLPRRSGISFIFQEKNRLSRINKYGCISFEVESSEKNIEVLIPDDMSVFRQLISPSYSRSYRDDIREEKVVHYDSLYYSEKGRYLDGVVGLFPSLWHANKCFEERLWRKISLIFVTSKTRAKTMS
jgi:hypothetical protein